MITYGGHVSERLGGRDPDSAALVSPMSAAVGARTDGSASCVEPGWGVARGRAVLSSWCPVSVVTPTPVTRFPWSLPGRPSQRPPTGLQNQRLILTWGRSPPVARLYFLSSDLSACHCPRVTPLAPVPRDHVRVSLCGVPGA